MLPLFIALFAGCETPTHEPEVDPYLTEPGAEPTLSWDDAVRVALKEGVPEATITWVDQVPYDADGDEDFVLVWGVTHVERDVLVLFIDPLTGEVLADEPPHAGLAARIAELGADDLDTWDGQLRGASPDTYDSFPWGWRLPWSNATGVMTRGYNNVSHVGSILYSTDWDPGNCGLDVYAPTSGWMMSNAYLGSWGNQIVIAGNCTGANCQAYGFGSRYLVRLAHLERTSPLQPGWWIEKGRFAGDMGTTGNSTGCHIHMTAYSGSYTGNGNISGSSLPIHRWPASGDSICNGRLAGYNFSDNAADNVWVGSSGCP